MAGSMKKTTLASMLSPTLRGLSWKQKHSSFMKWPPAISGRTLKVAMAVARASPKFRILYTNGLGLADLDLDRRRFGSEAPGEVRRDVRVEPDCERAVDHLEGRSGCEHRSAAEARDRTEEVIERDGSVLEAQHAGGDGKQVRAVCGTVPRASGCYQTWRQPSVAEADGLAEGTRFVLRCLPRDG
jgi:hypothetical protein